MPFYMLQVAYTPESFKAMLANPARTYYPGVLNDCYFEPSTALCLSRRPSAEPDAAPVMNHCQPAKCPNSCVLPQHRPAIEAIGGEVTRHAEVTDVAPDAPLPPSAFEFVFPTGTTMLY